MSHTHSRKFRTLTHAPRALLAPVFCCFTLLTSGVRAQDAPRAVQDPEGVGAGGPGPGRKAQNPDGPFRQNEVTKKALITAKPEPNFTQAARRNDTQGVVRLRVIFSSSGKVTDITVVKGLPDGLTAKAVEAAQGIRFVPAQKDGRPVSQFVTLEYNFNIYYVIDEKMATRKAVILEKPEPEYTEEARRRKVEGKVLLDVIFHQTGEIDVGVVKGLPYGLSEKAVEAARRIKFTPAELKGRPVGVRRRIEYVFKLD